MGLSVNGTIKPPYSTDYLKHSLVATQTCGTLPIAYVTVLGLRGAAYGNIMRASFDKKPSGSGPEH